MISVLDYISEELKSRRETITRFFDNNKKTINRAGFYRLMNDPSKIKESDIQKFVKALDLDEKKEREFRMVVRQSVVGYNEGIHEQVHDLIYSEPRFNLSKATEVEFFSTIDGRNSTIKTMEEILDDIKIDNDTLLKIKICNCISKSALSSIYTLIYGIRLKLQKNDNYTGKQISIEHILTLSTMDYVSKIAILLNIAHMIQISDYSFYFLEYDEKEHGKTNASIGEYLENTVLIQEVHGCDTDTGRENARYFVFHLTNMEGKRDFCFESRDRSYYGYYRAIFNSFRNDVIPRHSFATKDAAKLNEEISKIEKPYRKLLIKSDPCFDNILPDIWDKLVVTALSTEPEKIKRFRRIIDSENIYSFLEDEAFFSMQINYLRTRFNDNEHPGSINIYDVQGFIKFVETGITLESEGYMPPISRDLLKLQLLYIMNQIENYYANPNYQQFYFFKKPNATSGLFINIFDNKGICFLNEKCINLVNSNFFYTEVEIARLMYNVISNSLPSNEILSKEESLAFLKNQFALIGGADAEFNSYNN